MDNDIIETRMINRIARHFQVPPHRINRIHEADAELVDPGYGSGFCLAVTTDAVIEEIASGMYDDPYLMGWMLATVNFSDLAAVGADPLGLVISANLPPSKDEPFIERMSQGISDACRQAGSFVLGGDTNTCKELWLCGCAVGTVPKNSIITRKGAKPGDRCYLTGPAGLGGWFAFLKLTGQGSSLPSSFYQPAARIREGRIIRQYAGCCMDTSDGVIHTTDTLSRVNACRFLLTDDWEHTIHPDVYQACRSMAIPPWITMASVHGEFELLFTMDPEKESGFLQEAKNIGWSPLGIGEVDEGLGVAIKSGKSTVPVDSGRIRNLSEVAGMDHHDYIRELLQLAKTVNV